MGIIGLLFLALFGWGVYKLICILVDLLARANPAIASAVVAGSLTIVSSTIAVIVARSFEGRRDREAAHRERKVELYDGLLSELFKIFGESRTRHADADEDKLVDFFRESNRQLVLWSGPGGLKAYMEWQDVLKTQAGNPGAETMMKMVDFFLALRRDLGHSNRGLKREHLIGLLLSNPVLFMKLYQKDPSISLAEIAKAEQDLAKKG